MNPETEATTARLEVLKADLLAEIAKYEAFLSDPTAPQAKVEKAHALLDEAEGDLRLVKALLMEGAA